MPGLLVAVQGTLNQTRSRQPAAGAAPNGSCRPAHVAPVLLQRAAIPGRAPGPGRDGDRLTELMHEAWLAKKIIELVCSGGLAQAAQDCKRRRHRAALARHGAIRAAGPVRM